MTTPKRPAIGVTTDRVPEKEQYLSNYTYAAAVERAGGLPFLLPYRVDHALIGDYLDRLDGVLLTGGPDLDPKLWGGGAYIEGTSPIDRDRQSFELALLAEIERRRLPVLGVCLGSQVMNVHRGGSLHQFLPSVKRTVQIEHRTLTEVPLRHDVTVDTDSQLGRAIGSRDVSANTYHKQAVDRLGRGLKVIATAPDGVIEGFEDPAFPLFAAVQWHPERLVEEKEHLAPFKLLVDHAGRAT
jgi:putative glutamine amidotransferase